MTRCVDLEFLGLSNTVDYVNFVYEIWIVYLFDQEGGLEVSAHMWYLLINTCTHVMLRCQPDAEKRLAHFKQFPKCANA